MLLSKVSLVYVSIPLQVVVKSAKIIPVMAAGRFITGRTYSAREYAGAALLCSGVALFSLAGGNASSTSSGAAQDVLLGVAMLLCTLCADALLGNWQERTMAEACMSPGTLLLLQTAFASGLSLAVAAAVGELQPGLEALRSGPYATQLSLRILAYGAVMLGGTAAVLALVHEFGAAPAVLVTLLRKCCSLAASYVLFPKPLNGQHLLGIALVLGAPYAAQAGAGLHKPRPAVIAGGAELQQRSGHA
jgi:adenosine 3'-phospho 5'-phosphosulfate transporter B3